MEKNMANNYTATLPDKLRLVDGVLVLADGGDVREYLREFARNAHIDSATPVVLMRRDGHEADRHAAWMMRNWGS